MRKINKYLIYNKNNEILVFYKDDKKCNELEIILPKIVVEGIDVYETNNYFQKIINLLDKESLIFLNQTIRNVKLMQAINYKLKKVDSQTIRNFYSCYKNFNKEELQQIIIEANELELVPEMVSISEFKNMIQIEKMNYCFPIEAVEELEQKLYYKKY